MIQIFGQFVIIVNNLKYCRGASAGIGSYTAEALYRQGATVYMACRNEEKTQKVISQIKKKKVNYEGGSLNFIKLDLNDLESVRECAREFLHGGLVLDVLINNAGCAVGGKFVNN